MILSKKSSYARIETFQIETVKATSNRHHLIKVTSIISKVLKIWRPLPMDSPTSRGCKYSTFSYHHHSIKASSPHHQIVIFMISITKILYIVLQAKANSITDASLESSRRMMGMLMEVGEMKMEKKMMSMTMVMIMVIMMGC